MNEEELDAKRVNGTSMLLEMRKRLDRHEECACVCGAVGTGNLNDRRSMRTEMKLRDAASGALVLVFDPICAAATTVE